MDGLLDVARKTYLQTVEEIYDEASDLSQKYDIDIRVHYTVARGYHLKIPNDLPTIPDEFVQVLSSII